MLERSGPVLKIICLGLSVLILYQFVRLATRKDPLARLIIPAMLSSSTSSNTSSSGKATNSIARQETGKKETNVPPATKGTGPVGRAMNFGPGPGFGSPGPPLPSAVQARIDRITQSEILAPVMRPLPMALLGIAGRDVLLRTANGQTGLLREGEELGGVKLLQVGTNRVLIEHEGQKKELSLFSGFGSETLLPKGKENIQ